MTRFKLAELTSGVGALVLGVGLGAPFVRWVGPAAGVVTLVGVLVHAFGMWDKHRIEVEADAERARWIVALYWVCWVMLGGLVVFLFIRTT